PSGGTRAVVSCSRRWVWPLPSACLPSSSAWRGRGTRLPSGRFRSPMTETLRVPGSHDLRRVIGDGEAIPDGVVEGLEERDLLELYRSMVLLRTYDERSVVFHRQVWICTFAIFWNHEAMKAGSVYAFERDDWIFPSYRESLIGLLPGIPVSWSLSC